MGQKRGLDRLEQLQRGARDQEHVEDDAREDLVGGRDGHGEHGRVQERLLGEHDPRHPSGEAAAAAQRQLFVGDRLLDALGSRSGQRGLGLVRGDRARESQIGLAAHDRGTGRRRLALHQASLLAAPRERRGHHDERDKGCRGDPEGDGPLTACDAHNDRQREAQARHRLHQDEAAVEREVLVTGQPAAREVAGGVGERAHDEHVVEGLVVVEEVVDDLFPQGQRGQQERQREAGLYQDRHAQGVLGVALRTALGDRA